MSLPNPVPTQSQSHWTIAKEIPVSVIITILVQTGFMIWNIAGLNNKLDNVSAQVTEIRLERYTKNDSIRDIALATAKFEDMNRRLLLIETKRK